MLNDSATTTAAGKNKRIDLACDACSPLGVFTSTMAPGSSFYWGNIAICGGISFGQANPFNPQLVELFSLCHVVITGEFTV